MQKSSVHIWIIALLLCCSAAAQAQDRFDVLFRAFIKHGYEEMISTKYGVDGLTLEETMAGIDINTTIGMIDADAETNVEIIDTSEITNDYLDQLDRLSVPDTTYIDSVIETERTITRINARHQVAYTVTMNRDSSGYYSYDSLAYGYDRMGRQDEMQVFRLRVPFAPTIETYLAQKIYYYYNEKGENSQTVYQYYDDGSTNWIWKQRFVTTYNAEGLPTISIEEKQDKGGSWYPVFKTYTAYTRFRK